jgi:putative NIF3 family GTP cyclohydrolase 1 type 2
MKCSDIHRHFQEIGPFVDWDRKTDSFKIGDPETEIKKVATVWNPTFPALREAHEKGADFVVAHESVFIRGGAGSEEEIALPSEQEKLNWLRETGLVVYRCHDLWDRFPEIGITWSWQKGLELGGEVIADRFPHLVTEIPPLSLEILARHVLGRIRELGQTSVAVVGDLNRPVSKVATGTGVTPDPIDLWNLGADVGIMTDDYFLYCREGAHGIEREFPMIIVNHGVAEEWGIRNLSKYLAKQFPDIEVFHIEQFCPYTTVTT